MNPTEEKEIGKVLQANRGSKKYTYCDFAGICKEI